ncbi:hypothetical protein Tco_0465492, partial [Tanacetum coccineum]
LKYLFQDFRYSDTERLSRSDEVLKLKNFKKDATLKLSKSTNQEWYEHVGPEVTRSQDDKVTRWQNEIMLDKMAEENSPAPTRSDDQLVLIKARLPYGKRNLLMDLQKLQKNPIFRISINILQNTNFFKAFTASANVPSIYIQQFWNTLTHEAKSGVYSFQLDEE